MFQSVVGDTCGTRGEQDGGMKLGLGYHLSTSIEGKNNQLTKTSQELCTKKGFKCRVIVYFEHSYIAWLLFQTKS